MENTDQVKVYHWKYDDGSRGYAVRLCQGEEDEWLEYDYCTKKTEFKRLIRNLESKYRSLPVTKKKCRILGGLSDMQPSDFSAKDADDSKKGIEAMNNLIYSSAAPTDSQKVMLQLVSAILAGYSAQACSKYFSSDYVSPRDRRAPIISVSYFDYAYLALEQIVSALAIDTAAANDSNIYGFSDWPLEAKYYPLLPHRNKDRSITDSAYLKLPKLPYAVMPQYRDTTMLVHCRFFSGREISELQRLNPWVSLVLYDTKKLLSAPVNIPGYVIALSSDSWDREKLRFTVERYASYVSRMSKKKWWEKRIKVYFRDIEQMILRYNSQANEEHIVRGRKYQVSCQMIALRLFLDSCVADKGITKGEALNLIARWYNILLPGCCPQNSLEGLTVVEEEPEPFRAQFERVICKILMADNYKHICFISEGNICPLKANVSKDKVSNDENSKETEYWAYVSRYESKQKEPHLVVRMRRKTFEQLFSNYCEEYHGNSLFKDIGQLGEEYIDALKARMYRDEDDASKKKTVDALVLNIDQMTFLPQELTDYLKSFHSQG